MIAMQYRFVLPADYDMEVIRDRIVTKGPLMDDFPGLACKAYLYGTVPENSYAPFYLWHSEEAMHRFLEGAAFAALARSFGWPPVHTWTPWHASVGAAVRQAGHATRSCMAIAPYSDVAELRRQEDAWALRMRERGALAVVVGFEAVTWTVSRLCLWAEAPAGVPPQEWQYRIGHVSAPGARPG